MSESTSDVVDKTNTYDSMMMFAEEMQDVIDKYKNTAGMDNIINVLDLYVKNTKVINYRTPNADIVSNDNE